MELWFPLADASASTIPTVVAPPAGGGDGGGTVPPPVVHTGGSETQHQDGAPPTTGPARTPGFLDNPMFLIMIGLVVVVYFFMFRGPKKEEKVRKKMLEEMKKGDEVMTIGGLVAKVVDIKDDRVVLKVDESNNIKATYLKSAIQRVISPEDKDKK